MRFSKNTTPIDLKIVRGSGAAVWSDSGIEFIDASAQTFNLIFGHCEATIDRAVSDQIAQISFLSSRFALEAHEIALNELSTLTEGRFPFASFKISSGSLAVEHAIKAARKKVGGHMAVSLADSYHGQSIETTKLSGRRVNIEYLGDRNVKFAPTPICSKCPVGCIYRDCNVQCLDEIEGFFGDNPEKLVSYFIVEPIMVEAGMIELPGKYLHRLRNICTKYGIALIYDEVQTGGGWLNRYCKFLELPVSDGPDLVAIGKALSSGYPLSAVLIGEAFDVLEYGEHEITYGGSPVGLAAFIAAAKLLQSAEIQNHKQLLINRLRAYAATIVNLDGVRHARGSGLMYSIGLENTIGIDRNTLQMRLIEKGIICRTTISADGYPSIQLKICLAMSLTQLDQIFELVQETVDELN